MPKNLRSSGTDVGAFISRMAAVLSGSARIPSWSMWWPRNLRLVLLNSHFSGLRVTPAAAILSSAANRRWSCSSLSRPNTRTSLIRQSTQSRPWRMEFIRLWKSFGALDIPKGSLLKQYLLDGVMKVVRRQELGESGICQNPLLASSLVNSLAPVSWANVSSTLGTSHSMPWLSGLRLTQIRIAPLFLGTTTMPAHHGVGTSTFEMTPMSSMRSSSSVTCALRGMGM